MAETVLARAVIRNATIREVATTSRWPVCRIHEWTGVVNPSIPFARRVFDGQRLIHRKIDVRIRHLILDAGTENEREVWDARILGDVK